MQTNLQFSEREYLRAKPKDTTFSEQRTLSLKKFTIRIKGSVLLIIYERFDCIVSKSV